MTIISVLFITRIDSKPVMGLSIMMIPFEWKAFSSKAGPAQKVAESTSHEAERGVEVEFAFLCRR